MEPKEYIDTITDDLRRADCLQLALLMEEITGQKPAMWQSNIIGFGRYRYKGKSGRSGEWFITGFAARKNDISMYILGGFNNRAELLEKLGKHKAGVGCVYVKKLSDVDSAVLRELVESSVRHMLATEEIVH